MAFIGLITNKYLTKIQKVFHVLRGIPLDARSQCSSLSNIDTEIPLSIRWDGMQVYVEDEQRTYMIVDNGSGSVNVFVKEPKSTVITLNSDIDLSVVQTFEFTHNLNTDKLSLTIIGGDGTEIEHNQEWIADINDPLLNDLDKVTLDFSRYVTRTSAQVIKADITIYVIY